MLLEPCYGKKRMSFLANPYNANNHTRGRVRRKDRWVGRSEVLQVAPNFIRRRRKGILNRRQEQRLGSMEVQVCSRIPSGLRAEVAKMRWGHKPSPGAVGSHPKFGSRRGT